MKKWKLPSAVLSLLAGGFALSASVQAETLLERGTYLAESIVACGNCHSAMGPKGPVPGMYMAGGLPIKEPGIDLITPNITQDKETGIGSWTDEQIIRSIREGVRPDGSIIGPPMPIVLYSKLSDRDVKAIVAYLRTIKPVKNVTPPAKYAFPLPPSYGPPVANVTAPDPSDKLAYGAYLAGPLGHCIECHTPMEKGRFDYENRLGAGGFEFHGPWGVSVSANITPAGIGDLSDAEIKRRITTGTRDDGSRLMPPMGYPYYAKMTDGDLDAIITYLRSLKPVE